MIKREAVKAVTALPLLFVKQSKCFKPKEMWMFLQENDKRGRYIYNGRIRDSEGGSVCVWEWKIFHNLSWKGLCGVGPARVCVFFFSLTVRNLVSTFHFAMCSKTGRGKVGIELCAVETGMLALVCTFEMLLSFDFCLCGTVICEC